MWDSVKNPKPGIRKPPQGEEREFLGIALALIPRERSSDAPPPNRQRTEMKAEKTRKPPSF